MIEADERLFQDLEPEPVLADVLNEVSGFIRRFVVVNPNQLAVLVLWVAHTHVFSAATTTPYLAITSPEKGSGKTRLLETLALLVRNPWLTARATAAALVRKIDADAPTTLFDELDATFKGEKEKAEATRGILNSGYNIEGRATVCVGQGASLKTHDFRTFCPKALAGLGKLPDTIRDRSIVIELKRKIAGEEADRFRRRYVRPAADPIRRDLEVWARGAIAELADADPDIPSTISDRAADCWESLLAIADSAGEEWAKKARDAAEILSGISLTPAADLSSGVRLLADIRFVFTTAGEERITSVTLAAKLAEIEESPWGPEFGKPFDARALARKLVPYRIGPKAIRFEEKVAKGYEQADFEDAFRRYAPLGDVAEGNISNNPDRQRKKHAFDSVTEQSRYRREIDVFSKQATDVTDVTDAVTSKGGDQDKYGAVTAETSSPASPDTTNRVWSMHGIVCAECKRLDIVRTVDGRCSDCIAEGRE